MAAAQLPTTELVSVAFARCTESLGWEVAAHDMRRHNIQGVALRVLREPGRVEARSHQASGSGTRSRKARPYFHSTRAALASSAQMEGPGLQNWGADGRQREDPRPRISCAPTLQTAVNGAWPSC